MIESEYEERRTRVGPLIIGTVLAAALLLVIIGVIVYGPVAAADGGCGGG